MRSRADGKTLLANTRGAGAQLELQSSEILGGENRRNRLMRTRKKPMEDLDTRRTVVQGGEGIDEALRTVVALDQRGQIHLRVEAIALVVDDEAVLAGNEQVEDPRDERRSREGKGMLAVEARASGEATGEVSTPKPNDEPSYLPQILPPERHPELSRDARDIVLVCKEPGEVELLKKAVEDAPAQAPAGKPGMLGCKAQDTFEVVAVATALEL